MLLTDDAVPTLFAHNKDKQPQKRKSSMLREEKRAKRQHCENAFLHQEAVENFEFDCNTKATQTDITMQNLVNHQIETSKKTTVNIGVQVCENMLLEKSTSNVELIETESELEEESEYVDSSDDEEIVEPHNAPKPSKTAFIVYWTSLLILLRQCLQPACLLPALITKNICKGSQLIVKLKCREGHESE